MRINFLKKHFGFFPTIWFENVEIMIVPNSICLQIILKNLSFYFSELLSQFRKITNHNFVNFYAFYGTKLLKLLQNSKRVRVFYWKL